MKLNDEQHESLLNHLQSKWKAPATCPVCKSNDWDVAKDIFELREFHGGSMVIGNSSVMPISPVTCKTCGNTVLINPLVAGIDLTQEA